METTKGSNTDQATKLNLDLSKERSKTSVTVKGSKFRRHVVKMQKTAAITKAFATAGNTKSAQHWKLLIH